MIRAPLPFPAGKARIAAGLLLLVPAGCIAGTVVDVATAPVRVAGSAVDMATTSQSEADEKRGRRMREREEKLADLDRDYSRHMRECNDGDSRACLKARDDYARIQQIRSQDP